MSGQLLLSATGVCYEYGAQPALSDVSLQVRAREIVALVGRNGAGKSTLLRCLAGWARPLAGKIHVLGLPVVAAERAVRQHVALVPDTPTFYDELTAWEHLQFFAQTHHLSGWEDRALKLLGRLGLWSSRQGYPFTFSRGMRYKLAICLALLIQPRLLLLDEPLGPLDPVSADILWDELRRSCSQGLGVMLSSHQFPPQVQPDRYLILEEGRIIARGTPGEISASLAIAGDLSLGALLRAALVAQGDAPDDV
jgi:ABC-2 type transport system ATP-binding protein